MHLYICVLMLRIEVILIGGEVQIGFLSMSGKATNGEK
jgi:hypothetical protein